MNTFEVTSSTGGGVDLKNTVSLAKECQDLIVKAAGLTKIREDVLLPILYYLANEAEEKLTLNSDPIKLTWEILRQGSFMCELINQVQPGVITETYLPVPPITPGHFKDINSRQNISAFIRACRDMFFMKDDEIFSVGDLYKEDFITFGKALKLCQFYLGNKIRVSTRNSISLRLDELDEDDAKLFFIQEAIIQEEGEEASEEDKKKSRKRALLIQELVASERVYVNDLTKLNQYSEAVKSSHVISQPLINAIFSNLKALVNFQKKFLIQLESEVSKKSNMDLGTLFQVNETEFQVYETFCTNHKNSMETLREQLANLQKQPDLIEGLGDLSGYLIKPVQRITRYHLFFRDLLKESKKQRYDDIPKLQTAIQVIKRITTSINEKQREAENALIAEEFYERFPTGKITLEKTGKLVLYDSSMKMRLGDNLKNYRIYLFEKRIVMCSERDKFGPFWMKNQLASNTIKSVALKDSGLSAEPFEIEVSCQDEEKVANWSLLLRTEQHAALWSKYIRVVAGLPADTSKEEAEEVIEIVPVEETKMEPTSHSEPAMQKEYFWISEFMDEKYFISTESIPTLVDLKTEIRNQIENEFLFDGKNTSLIPRMESLALQFKLDGELIHLQNDRTLSYIVSICQDAPISLLLYRPKQIRIRALFREVLYSFTVDELETLAELKTYIYETIKEDYLQIQANLEAIPVPERMRLFFKEPDNQWSILLYDNDLETALELNQYKIDVRL